MSTLNEETAISVKPDKVRLLNLLDEIRSGTIKIPVFQRDFVWKPHQMLELFDSIFKGYPIGSLLLWKPAQEFKTKKYIGPYNILRDSSNKSYVLDGFQRITTLFGALVNPSKFEDEQKLPSIKEYLIFYNLKEKEFSYLRSKSDKLYYLIPIYKIIDTFEFLDFIRNIEMQLIDRSESTQLIENAKEISKVFYDYEIPFVEIRGGDIKSAVEIFSRINSTGTEISEDFMLSALSYNQETDFLFSENISSFVDSLSQYNFDSIKRDTILNCIANSKGKIYFDVKIEELLKPDLEILTTAAFIHIEKAVRFLALNLCVLDVRLLPYPTQLIFISEFFRVNTDPTEQDILNLEKWFWTTTYSNYFTIYSLSQQRNSYETFMKFASGHHVDGILRLNETFDAAKFPEKLNFTGVRTKALQLYMLNVVYSSTLNSFVEKITEVFIFHKYGRMPGNIILMKESDYISRAFHNNVSIFFNTTSKNELLNYFITEELIDLYNNNDVEKFIIIREKFVSINERKFVENFGIRYDDKEIMDGI